MMRTALALFVLLGLLVTTPAAAQGTAPSESPPESSATPVQAGAATEPAPPPAAPPEDEERRDPPKAHTGLQMALRTGVAIASGESELGGSERAAGNLNTQMSRLFGAQVPVIVDLGTKVTRALFLGGYMGFSFGGPGSNGSALCDEPKVDCTALGLRIGVQVHLQILPRKKVNPWIGYGIGYEMARFGGEKSGNKVNVTYGGIELAHFMAGADFRVSHVFGVGPFIDLALGRYSTGSIERRAGSKTLANVDGGIDETTMHQWLLIGARVVLFP